MIERRSLTVTGIVQGVGFRPFVHALATGLGLVGTVRNRAGTVLIDVQGSPVAVDEFLRLLQSQPPPLARIKSINSQSLPSVSDWSSFRIEDSDNLEAGEIYLSPDVATCPDCLAELFDPGDRRYRYPFLNCTHCGPRLTIIRGAPYDRERTTLAGFPLCPACRAEYDDPSNRRFHAQPTCCPVCGPRLRFLDPGGTQHNGEDALIAAVRALRAGQVGAIKGLGGYHLACDATSAAAVTELRRRKHRDEKPFALMVRDLAAAEELCEISPTERELLISPARPIILLRKRQGTAVAEMVAAQNPYLGLMLPYTPLHHLLLGEVPWPLIMTSGNRADEPIAYLDEDALDRLGGLADFFLVHDRPIHVRCDDSVTRIVEGGELPLRRSRGYAPVSVPLPVACPVPVLAVGGQLKGTFALGRGRQAIVSHHLGDLDDYEAYLAFERDVGLYGALFEHRPEVIVHDLHPDYPSTVYAQGRAAAEGLRLVGVQHHHAHLAACMVENGLDEMVIGVTFDGSGYGSDGAIWGGEFLLGDYTHFRRAGHLRYVALPGGEQAIREPWRLALAHLRDADADCPAVQGRVAPNAWRLVQTLIARGVNCPLTSSVGRLFDAVGSLVGVRDAVSYEGQAAQQLEWLATTVEPGEPWPFAVEGGSPLVIDTRPLVRAVVEDVNAGLAPALLARRFHDTMIEMIARVCGQLRQMSGCEAVVLSGGVFLNVLLLREVTARLQADGFRVYRHRVVPPGDGGLCLGQLAVAAHWLTG